LVMGSVFTNQKMIHLHVKLPNPFVPEAEVILRGPTKDLQNIVQKLKIFRNVDSDLRQINSDDIQPALDVLLKR